MRWKLYAKYKYKGEKKFSDWQETMNVLFLLGSLRVLSGLFTLTLYRALISVPHFIR